MSNWRRKLSEGLMSHSVYWMVDHEASPVEQVKIPVEQVRFAYGRWKDTGSLQSLRDDVRWKSALSRLFAAVNPGKLSAFIDGREWTPPGSQRRGPSPITSVTGGGVDLSSFRLLDEEVEYDDSAMLTEGEGLFHFLELSGQGKFDKVKLPWATVADLARDISDEPLDRRELKDLSALTTIFSDYYSGKSQVFEMWDIHIVEATSHRLVIKIHFSVSDSRQPRNQRTAKWAIVQDYE